MKIYVRIWDILLIFAAGNIAAATVGNFHPLAVWVAGALTAACYVLYRIRRAHAIMNEVMKQMHAQIQTNRLREFMAKSVDHIKPEQVVENNSETKH